MLSVNLKQRWCSGVNLAESGRSLVLRIVRPLFWMTRGSIYRCRRLIFRLKWGETSSGTSGGPHGRNLEIRAHFGIDSTLGSNRSRNHPIELKFIVNILHYVFELLWKFHVIWICRSWVMTDSIWYFLLPGVVRIDTLESIRSNQFSCMWRQWRGAHASGRSSFTSEFYWVVPEVLVAWTLGIRSYRFEDVLPSNRLDQR